MWSSLRSSVREKASSLKDVALEGASTIGTRAVAGATTIGSRAVAALDKQLERIVDDDDDDDYDDDEYEDDGEALGPVLSQLEEPREGWDWDDEGEDIAKGKDTRLL